MPRRRTESGCIGLYMDEYERWLAQELDDADLRPELLSIQGLKEEIKDRFAVELAFGTAGLRGVLGAGTNRMNVWCARPRRAANYLLRTPGEKSVAISYDSRIKKRCVRARGGLRAGRQRREGVALQRADARACAQLCHALFCSVTPASW